MKNRRRLLFIRNDKSSNNTQKPPKKDMDFMSWKAELNTELLSFWKTIEENYED